jgi:hypothetical protein
MILSICTVKNRDFTFTFKFLERTKDSEQSSGKHSPNLIYS